MSQKKASCSSKGLIAEVRVRKVPSLFQGQVDQCSFLVECSKAWATSSTGFSSPEVNKHGFPKSR